MVKTVAFAVSLVLLTITSTFVVTPAVADEDIAAENAKLTAQLASVKADRDHLRGRLQRAIAFSSERGDKLAAAETDRANLRDRLRRAIAFSSERGEKLEAAETSRDNLRGRLRRAIAFSSERGEKLEAAETSRDNLRGRLRRAIAFSSERGDKLESAETSRDMLRSRLRRAIAHSKSTRIDLEQQLAATGNGGSGGASTNWAKGVGDSLQANIGGLQGTEVIINENNTVKVQVGNNGLFRTGGNALSASGEALLSQIVPQLVRHRASITVIGHTDSIPTGANNRFGSNEALSFARAISTLQFLQNQGIPTQQLSAAGFGAESPIADNNTPEGRQKNRRVDIVLRAQ